MSKILAIADVHIHDYPQRNPEDRYRLNQSRVVASNVINAAIKCGADTLVIAGDILEKSVIRPYVQAEVKNFLDTVMAHFKVGYIIWGNHDQDNKGSDQDFTDSCLSVMLPPNLHYADKREIVIDNTRIGFSNWRPEFDLTWINGQVDVLFTHATISYTGGDIFKSQVLDESKFGLAICGDIHRPGSIGKYVSIGASQKCKMGDSDESTCVVFDCITKSWEWVNLNSEDNLMKFQYTPIREEEGWKEDIGTWLVYKPENQSSSMAGVNNIQIPAWEEVGNLIDGIIKECNLEVIHGEVLKNMKNLESKEVDFNFVLTRFYCKNWRSIDEVELYFDNFDKILLTGRNGSGKSSLLSAIRYAFLENRFIKDFIQFGTKECVAEVEFIYQGHTAVITRGSKKYGLTINGEQMKYNNKKEFEEDVRLRYPFIDYMDIYFFDSDHHKLLGGIAPERKSEIISKFFKMDRIDAYNEEAEVLLGLVQKDTQRWRDSIDSSTKILEYIERNLQQIVLPTVTLDTLRDDRSKGLELQRKAKLWSDHQVACAQLLARVQYQEELVQKDAIERQNYRDIQLVKQEGEVLKAQIDSMVADFHNEGESIRLDYQQKLNLINQLTTEGNRLYAEWGSIGKESTCPTCSQVIKKDEATLAALANRKTELERLMTDLQTQIAQLNVEAQTLQAQVQANEERKRTHNAEVEVVRNKLNEVIKEYYTIEAYHNRSASNISSLSKIREEYLNSQKVVVEEVTVPDNFIEIMAELDKGITAWNDFAKLEKDRSEVIRDIKSYQSQLDSMSFGISELQRYIKLTGPTGKIYEEIMTKLANQFSDNLVKYEVKTYNFRKKDHLDLSSYFYNNGNWVSYQACSSGQQTVLDVNFLSKIVTRMGLLIMDEFLKHLDPFYHDVCTDLIGNMNIGCIMLSSHMESIATFNNKTCQLELNNSGMTKINLK